jgi:hypothetical protein
MDGVEDYPEIVGGGTAVNLEVLEIWHEDNCGRLGLVSLDLQFPRANFQRLEGLVVVEEH